ncbi:hypothetical protein [Nocardia wallacei]|uniref:hypothetical protein n=1 Tax=Nocardia wallacei TaxID=480035 RepID=UPI0024570D9F|nr:hypothetical protein [Nocardia wallacei]
MPREAQLVYTTIKPTGAPPPRCSALPAEAVGGVLATLASGIRWPRVLFGTVAQYDEAEEDVPAGHVPVRVGHGRRSRVIAAPLHRIRPVG